MSRCMVVKSYFVFHICRSPRRRKRTPTPESTKVYIGHLTRTVTKEHIREIFATYGVIKSVEMPNNRLHPANSIGYAYVEYAKAEDAERAINNLDGGQIDGQEVTASAVLARQLPNRGPMRRSPPRRPMGGMGGGRWGRDAPRYRRRLVAHVCG